MSVHDSPTHMLAGTKPIDRGLSDPAAVVEKLAAIENDLAELQNEYEAAALAWYRRKRDKEKARAIEFIRASGTVAERQAHADRMTADIGRDEESTFEAFKAVERVLAARASIGQSILRAQSRA